MNVHVLMCVVHMQLTPLVLVFMVIPVCDLMEVVVGLHSPSPLLCRAADQTGRREVQDASGSQSRELRHTDGQV